MVDTIDDTDIKIADTSSTEPKKAPIIIPKQHAIDKDFFYNDDKPLLHFGKDPFLLKHAFEGVLCLGGTGAGKSSATGKTLAHAYLKAGMGGIILCTKPSDADDWREYAKQTKRESSFIFFDDSETERFNFLSYEMACSETPLKSSLNITELFIKIGEAAQGNSGAKKSQDMNSFWDRSVKLLIRNTLEAIIAAYGTIEIEKIKDFIYSVPRKGNDPLQDKKGFALQTLNKAFSKPAYQLEESAKKMLANYFNKSLYAMDSKTFTNILATFESFIFPFDTGMLRNLFCTDTTVIPDMTHHGAVIVVDLPARKYYEQSLIASHIWKYLWQRATERRNTKENARGVFLFVDECQSFLSDTDADFQSTARSSRACSVYLTQNISGIYAKIGDEHKSRALLGNLRTKIFHSNDEYTTNQYCADVIGKTIQHRRSWNIGENNASSHGKNEGYNTGMNRGYSENYQDWSFTDNRGKSQGESYGTNESTTQGTSRGEGMNENIDYELQPSFFATGLRTGGKENNYIVDGVVFQSGRATPFANGKKWTICSFQQR